MAALFVAGVAALPLLMASGKSAGFVKGPCDLHDYGGITWRADLDDIAHLWLTSKDFTSRHDISNLKES